MEALQQPRLWPAVFGLMFTDFKVVFNDPETIRNRLENFFESLDDEEEYDCKSTTENWKVSSTVYASYGCTLVEADIMRTQEPNVYVIHLIYARYYENDLFRNVLNRMLLYFANNIYQACAHSQRALNNAQQGLINPFGFINGPQIPQEELIELVTNRIKNELPRFASIYFEENVNSAGRLNSTIHNNEMLEVIGHTVDGEYIAYQDYANNPQEGFEIGSCLLFVDTVLKYAIGKPIYAGDHGISKETRTLSACMLSKLANNANCAHFLRAVHTVIGCNRALEALDDSAENYVLKKKLREVIEHLNPQPMV